MDKKKSKKRTEDLNLRADEFLKCLGNGKSMIEIEQEECDY